MKYATLLFGDIFQVYLHLIWRIPVAMMNNLITEFERQVHVIDNAISQNVDLSGFLPVRFS